MANNTETQKPKERVKYKFGQSDIDLTNYIHNLGTNVQSYLNSKNWNDGQKQEFMNAYNRYLTGLQDQLANNTNRFTTDDFGSIIDSTGALSNTDNDDIDPVGSEYYYDDKGNRITTDDFNALKKRKQKNYNTFSANREVATYFNAIGNALRSKQPTKEQTSNAFDLSKHGFLADWTRINNPAGGNLNLDPYLEKDAVDEATGKRGTTNRAAYLKEQIENYINNIGDYDFSSTPFKDRNTYVSRLRAAAENLGNGYNSEDVIALNQAGIGNEFLSKFFSTGAEEPQAKQSELERQAEQSAQELAQRRRDDELRAVIEEEKQDQYNRQRDAFFADYQKQNPFNSTIKSQAIALSYNPNAMYDRAATKYGVDRSNTEALQSAVKEYINFPQLAAAIRGKEHILQGQKDVTAAHIANNLDWAAQSNLLTDKIGDTGYYIVPGSENYDNWSYIAYNPITRHYEEQSMLLNEELKKKMAYAEYDRRNKDVQKHQLGGLLKYTEEYQKKAQKEAEKQQRIDQKVEETARKATQYALNNNWFTNLYNQKSLTGWDSSKDASKAGVSITNQNASHGNAGDLSIPFYKNLMYTSQSNLVGQDLQSYYNSAFQGKSLEDYVNGYNANAAKIRGYWDQERAYRQAGASEHNRLFRNMFGNRSNNSNDVWNIGYDPKLDDVVGSSTWLRRMDRYEKEFDALSDEEKKARVHKIDLGGGNVGYVYKKANGDIAIWNEPVAPEQPTEPAKPASTTTVIGPEQPKKEGDTREMFSFLRNINPTIAYGLPRAVYADRMNRRMTDLAKASVTPLLKDPFQVHRYTRSDLDAEMQGERNYANLRRLASRPITSDGSLQTATQLQAEVQGQEARTAGKEKSNQTQRQYDELAWQQEKENAANRHETAMFNRAQQWGADQDKSKFEQAYLSKKFNIWDTFGQQLEYDARTKQQENKALADNFARSDIHNAVNYAPNDYGANLTPEELTVWNKVLSGTNPSSLSTQEFNSYRLAAQKVSRVETDQLRQHYNIPNTRWSGKAGVPNTPWSASISYVKKGGIISAKNGSKIAVAGIEAKTADAERFQKQIKDCIDRNEKTLDRLSKSLYGLIKASMIK